jgi:hypothetical protein|tara:strand:- start:142 stop:612 length:471 start_codon:yes stop_codon:yes gene_type:complete
MSDLTVVTPPDTLFTNDVSFLLIYPSRDVKDDFQNLIMKFKESFTVYIYEIPELEENVEIGDATITKKDLHEPQWLLNHCHIADYVILDIDNCPPIIRDLASYIVANTNTFWLTNDPNIVYNKLSNKRIYHLDYLVDIIGANLAESKLQQKAAEKR